MRVAILTPLDERSAIAKYTLAAVDALDSRWDVDLWYPACDRPLWTCHATRPFWDGSEAARELDTYDLVVYVLGNSGHHREILAAARLHPGLVILHDRSLTHLFAAFDQAVAGTTMRMAAVRAGEQTKNDFERFQNGEPGLMEILDVALPMTDVALQNSLGVLTHSQWMADQIRGESLGRVTVARLPGLAKPVTVLKERPVRSHGERVVIVVAGAVNANKCVDRIIAAVAGSSVLRSRAALRVVGSISARDKRELSALARTLGIEDGVEILGALPIAGYQATLRSADVFACLRDPVLEAASSTLLEELSAGIPVVIYDQGHYSELPDGTAFKVDPTAGRPALQRALERVVEQPKVAEQIGLRGQEYAARAHSVEQYVVALLEAGQVAMHARPRVLAVDNLRKNLAHVGLDMDAYARRQSAKTLHRLFCAPSSGAR